MSKQRKTPTKSNVSDSLTRLKSSSIGPYRGQIPPEHLVRLAEVREVFDDVVACLPRKVKTTLRSFWANVKVLNYHLNIVEPAPVVLAEEYFTENYYKKTGKIARAVNMDGSTFIFDHGWVFGVPPIVVRTIIAHEVAHTYQIAKDKNIFNRKYRALEKDVNRIIAKWGYFGPDLETWQAVKETQQSDWFNVFYAYRLAKDGLQPPADADMETIKTIALRWKR